MIQLSLEFQLEKPQLPLEYERLMVSFLKAASRNYSEDMFERLYNKEHSIIKSFTFSTYLPGAVFKGDTIFLRDNRFKVFFTDADMGQIIEWFNAFQLMRYKQYPVSGNSMKLISIRSNNRNENCKLFLQLFLKYFYTYTIHKNQSIEAYFLCF